MGLSGYLPVPNVVVHLVASVTMVYSVYYNYTHVNIPTHVNPIPNAYGGQFKYLTFLDGCFLALYFTYALIEDICSIVSSSKTPTFDKLSQVKSCFFACIVFPGSTFVSTMFWGLYFLDRNLVMPKYLDVYFPSWLNHTMHTFVSVFACLEMITAYRPYPSRVNGLRITSIFILTYFVWIHIVYSQCNLWVYPILSQLNMFYRTLFFLGLFIHSASLYLIGEYTNLKLWDFQRQKIQEKHQ